MMLIDNILYGIKEVSKPTFVLKTDVEEALKTVGPEFEMPQPQDSLKFKGKYYAYFRVKQKENDKETSTSPEVHPEGPDTNVANNQRG